MKHKHVSAGVIDRSGLVRKRWEFLFTHAFFLFQHVVRMGYIRRAHRARELQLIILINPHS